MPIAVTVAVLAGAGGLGAYGIGQFRDRELVHVSGASAPVETASDVDLALAEVTAPPEAPSEPASVAQPAPVLAPPQAEAPTADRAIQKRPAKRKAAPVQVAEAVDEGAVAAAARERQQRDYEAAVARYDASEREEGYRWAQTNRVRTARYCRTTAKRTDAFMEGCLSFVSKASERGGSRAATPSPADMARSET